MSTVDVIKALADETRLRIINLIGNDELCICQLQSVLKMSQPRISRHVKILRDAGIINSRQEAQKIFLSLGLDYRNIITAALKEASSEPVFKRDNKAAHSAVCGVK